MLLPCCLIDSHTHSMFVFNKTIEGDAADSALFTVVELLKTRLVIQKPQGTCCFVVYVPESIQQITRYCTESLRFYSRLQECDHKTRTISGTVCMLLERTPNSWTLCCRDVVSTSSPVKRCGQFSKNPNFLSNAQQVLVCQSLPSRLE